MSTESGFERFRQSYAKLFITDCADEVRRALQGDQKKTTPAMEGGSLFDALVFERDDRYEVVEATLATGERAGEVATNWQAKAAQEGARSVRALGKLPVLPCELDALAPQAQRARARYELLRGEAHAQLAQEKLFWTSELGVPCRGEPDWCWLNVDRAGIATVYTADLKRTASVHPRAIQRQVFAMCWDVQAAAYREAAISWAREWSNGEPVYGGHTIIACEQEGRGRVKAYPLSESALVVGKERWETAQKQWLACLASGVWPDYEEGPIEPPRWLLHQMYPSDSDSDLSDIGVTIDTEET